MTRTTPKPIPTPLAMSPAPVSNRDGATDSDNQQQALSSRTSYPEPRLRLECRDLDHPGANVFFSNANPARTLSNAVSIVLSTLYTPPKDNAHIPGTRSVTLILRPMPGVAYTTGTDLDNDHKEIHFSLDYISGINSRTPGRETHEIQGVIVHEMVHAWQWNAKGTAPGGLIEGIADFVRLKAGLDPPHWKKEAGGDWDAGYQHTAYFLAWLEEQWGRGSVRKINERLRDEIYGEQLWEGIFGKTVGQLWKMYEAELSREHNEASKERQSAGEDIARVTTKDGADPPADAPPAKKI